jgi:iduronate 2-sulfatase
VRLRCQGSGLPPTRFDGKGSAMPGTFRVCSTIWAALLHLGPALAEAATPPNVLFISADDMRFELGAHGAPWVQTPHLDRLAAQGAILLQAHCQYPQCAPSRASVFTGRRPDTTRVYDVFAHFRPALPDVVTLPQLFKQHGYSARAFGKVYHTNLDDAASWSVPHEEPQLPPIHYANAATAARIAEKVAAAARMPGLTPRQRAQAAYGPAWEAEDLPDSAYHDGQVTDRAIAALGEYARQNAPFFLAVGYRKPHLPFVAPKRYWDLYDPAQLPLAVNPGFPDGAPPCGPVDGGEFRAYENMPAYPTPMPDAEARRLKHGYYACVSFVDAQVGRLVAELDRLGLANNTLVVFWSDHGFHLGEQAHWGKWSPYEWDTRSPLLLCGPGVPAGVATPALIEFVDIYPTVAELAGLPAPQGLEGVSFAPLLRDPGRPWKSAVFSQVLRFRPEGNLMAVTMRTERHRLTRWTDESDRARVHFIELYDRTTNPDEMRNIADDPAHAAVLAELLRQFDAGWRGALPGSQHPEE